MSRPLSMLSAQGMLGVWAAKKNLGDELFALTTECVYAQAILHIAYGKETDNPSRDALLLQLQLVVHDAYVVLNELDYFRVQDKLNAVDVPPKGFVDRLHFYARHVARVAAKLKPSSSSHDDNAKFIEKLASVDLSSACCVGNELAGNEWQVHDAKAPKPKFNRVVLSTKMTNIVKKLNSLSVMVSSLIKA